MELKQAKDLVNLTGDLRQLVRENDGVRIYDLFVNSDNVLVLEQYSVITKSELEEMAKDKNTIIDADTVDSLLSCVKLWHADENETEDFKVQIEEFFKDFDVEKISGLPQLSFNDTVIEFMNNDLDNILYRGC